MLFIYFNVERRNNSNKWNAPQLSAWHEVGFREKIRKSVGDKNNKTKDYQFHVVGVSFTLRWAHSQAEWKRTNSRVRRSIRYRFQFYRHNLVHVFC